MTGRFTLLLVLAATSSLTGQASAQTGTVDSGRQLSMLTCSDCHDVSQAATGGDKAAPAFRDFQTSYSLGVDNQAFLEDLATKHSDQTSFEVTPQQAADIAAYIVAIQSLARGHELLELNCASCHSIGTSGESPHPEAPPFRTLSQDYPVSELEEALAEGIMTGHEDMPVFVAQPQQIDDMIAYLESIQE